MVLRQSCTYRRLYLKSHFNPCRIMSSIQLLLIRTRAVDEPDSAISIIEERTPYDFSKPCDRIRSVNASMTMATCLPLWACTTLSTASMRRDVSLSGRRTCPSVALDGFEILELKTKSRMFCLCWSCLYTGLAS